MLEKCQLVIKSFSFIFQKTFFDIKIICKLSICIMDENIIVSPIYVILNSVFSTYNLNLMSNPSASSKTQFLFWKEWLYKKIQQTKNKKTKKTWGKKTQIPGRPDNQDYWIARHVIILVADIMLLAVLSTFGRLSPSTMNVVTN